MHHFEMLKRVQQRGRGVVWVAGTWSDADWTAPECLMIRRFG